MLPDIVERVVWELLFGAGRKRRWLVSGPFHFQAPALSAWDAHEKEDKRAAAK